MPDKNQLPLDIRTGVEQLHRLTDALSSALTKLTTQHLADFTKQTGLTVTSLDVNYSGNKNQPLPIITASVSNPALRDYHEQYKVREQRLAKINNVPVPE